MSFLITEAFVSDFRAGITLRAQQTESRLRSGVRVESGIRGVDASFDHVSKRNPSKRTSRHADTKLTDTPHDRRWVDLFVWDDADLIDKPDLVRTLTDPTNVYTRSMSAGFGRKIDEIIMDAADAVAKTGQTGTGTAAHPAASQIATAGGMTIAKITETLRLLDSAEQPSDRTWAVTAMQIEDMLGLNEIRSSDFNVVRALAQGGVSSFAGFTFVRVEDPILKFITGTQRKTFAWNTMSLLVGFGMDVTASIDRRPDKNNSMQVFYSADFGAVRMDDTGVIRIRCDE